METITYAPRAPSLLAREFDAARISADLRPIAVRFEQIRRDGPEHEHDFLRSRLGHLYQTMVDASAVGVRLSNLARESFVGQSTKEKDLAARGRERLVTALRLCEEVMAQIDPK